MAIRSEAKALVLHEGKLLLNRCRYDDGQVRYDLPGGGQNPYEIMEEAVRREVLEETGYTVQVDRFVALAEEICEDGQLRQQYPDYAHRIHHIFLAHPTDKPRCVPTEADRYQDDCKWFSLQEAEHLPLLFPLGIQSHLTSLLTRDVPIYLGCSYTK